MRGNGIRRLAALALGCALASVAPADRITVDGETLEGVHVRESGSLYYIQDPRDGSVRAVPRNSVAEGALERDPDEAARAARLERWHAARGPQARPAPPPPAAAPVTDTEAASSERPGPPVLRLRGEGRYAERTDGHVPYVHLKDAPLGEALRATLRPMGLDYQVQGNYLWISTPDRLRTESFEPIDTRVYQVRNESQALPKIVLRQGFAGGNPGGGGFGGLTGAGRQGGFGGGQFGGGQFGQGGFGNRGFGGGGFQGGLQGNDVTGISNISDMFSTIDDALVGEPPATIGIISTRR